MRVPFGIASALTAERTRPTGAGRAPLYPLSILGTGSALPATVLSAAELDRLAGQRAGWTQETVGARQRHMATTETAVDLAAEAARRALGSSGLAPSAVDCIIATGALPHQGIPTTAVFVEQALGLDGSGIPAFDINATCLGFLVALDTAGALISAGRYETVLLVACDLPSRGTSWADPEVKALFGDGAAAAVVRRSATPGAGVLALALETYSEGAPACEMRAGGTGLDPHADYVTFLAGTTFRMDGVLSYRIAAQRLPPLLTGLLDAAGVTLDDIDAIVLHQASAHGLRNIIRRLDLPLDKVVNLFATHGNQVSASLPTVLDHAITQRRVRRGGLVLLLGAAAGITVGGAVLRL